MLSLHLNLSIFGMYPCCSYTGNCIDLTVKRKHVHIFTNVLLGRWHYRLAFTSVVLKTKRKQMFQCWNTGKTFMKIEQYYNALSYNYITHIILKENKTKKIKRLGILFCWNLRFPVSNEVKSVFFFKKLKTRNDWRKILGVGVHLV